MPKKLDEKTRKYERERKAAWRAQRKAKLSGTIENNQAETKPNVPDMSRNVPTKKCPPYNPPINTQTSTQVLFPESLFLSEEKTLEVGVCARGIASATLTSPFVDYATRWSNWDSERIEREFEKCRAHYTAYPPAPTANFWGLWQAWVQRGHEREEQRFEPGTIGYAVRRKIQVEEALGVIANGQVRPSNGSGMRQSNLQDVPSANGHRSESLGAGTGNVVHGAFGGGGQERDKYGYPKAQKVSDGGAPRRLVDGRGRAD